VTFAADSIRKQKAPALAGAAGVWSLAHGAFDQSRFTRPPPPPPPPLLLLPPEDDPAELRLPPPPLLELPEELRALEPPLLPEDEREPRSTLPELRPLLELPLRVEDPLLELPLRDVELPEEPLSRGRMRTPPTLSITRRDGALLPLEVLLPEVLLPEELLPLSRRSPPRSGTRLRHVSFEPPERSPDGGVACVSRSRMRSRSRQLGPDERGVSAGWSASRPRRSMPPLDEPPSAGCEVTGGVVVDPPRFTRPLSIGATPPRPIGATLPRPIGATEDEPPPMPREGTPPATAPDPDPAEPPRERITRSRTSPETLPSRRKNGVMSVPTPPAPVSAPVRRPSRPRRRTASAGSFHSSRVKRDGP
jgi:hypothetical protein